MGRRLDPLAHAQLRVVARADVRPINDSAVRNSGAFYSADPLIDQNLEGFVSTRSSIFVFGLIYLAFCLSYSSLGPKAEERRGFRTLRAFDDRSPVVHSAECRAAAGRRRRCLDSLDAKARTTVINSRRQNATCDVMSKAQGSQRRTRAGGRQSHRQRRHRSEQRPIPRSITAPLLRTPTRRYWPEIRSAVGWSCFHALSHRVR
ncbi:hypothetical protein OH77DRAFT_967672 [Trametes cingulata]|nr:hypothetical protein OH77DRAFT_967672 [Trametes cingulata]